jgi:hypothetical protein
MKQSVKGSSQAEMYAIANALHILVRDHDLSKYKLIIYSDNKYALKNHLDGTLKKSATKEQKSVYDKHIRPYIQYAQSYEARHVKAHLPSDKWGSSSARHYMQNWCDEEVHRIMKIATRQVLEEQKLRQKSACVLEQKGA